MPDALMLLNDGLDALTALACTVSEGYALLGALSYNDGQRHAREVAPTSDVAAHYHMPHAVSALAPICGAPHADLGGIPQGHDLGVLTETVAPTAVANRNLILIAYAAAHALLGPATHVVRPLITDDKATRLPSCDGP